MLVIKKIEGGLQADVNLGRPCIYVDYAGIADLAEDAVLGERFKNGLLGKKGTLYVSWAHLLEIYGLGTGRTYDKIKAYLASFGANFVMMDCHAEGVIERERVYTEGEQNPSLDVDYIKLIMANWDSDKPFSFRILLQTIDSEPSSLSKFKEFHKQYRENIYRELERARKTYQTNPQTKRNLDQKQYRQVPGINSTEYLRDQLLREMIKTHEPLKKSDGLDYHHAVVALAYCDVVVLDKQWAARVQRFPAPTPMARVYKVGELKELVDALNV